MKNLMPLLEDILTESVLIPSHKFLYFSPIEIARFHNKDTFKVIRKAADVSDIFLGDYIKPEWNKVYIVSKLNKYADVSDCESCCALSESELQQFCTEFGDDIPVIEITLSAVVAKQVKRFFYDCEFEESQNGIKLISIGIVSEEGQELYLINKDYDWNTCNNTWLIDNVKPYVISAPDYLKVSYSEIGCKIIDFIKPNLIGNVKLYGYYSAYDHVCLCQTFGRMIDLPEGMPMYTIDLKQYLDYFGINKDILMNNVSLIEHDALEDAKWNFKLYTAIKKLMGVDL